jgi:FixJ family two-component response regulator
MTDEPTVYVVDDDPAVGRAVAAGAALLGCRVEAYPSPAAFLAGFDPGRPGCLVLDIRMPGMSGVELLRKLADGGGGPPVVMVSGHADVRTAVEVMTLGAVTLLEKPFGLDELLDRVREAVARDRAARAARRGESDAEARLARLTPKEREVLELVAAGRTNRDIAAALGLSLRAVEDRRARVMRKVGVASVAELVRVYGRPGRG